MHDVSLRSAGTWAKTRSGPKNRSPSGRLLLACVVLSELRHGLFPFGELRAWPASATSPPRSLPLFALARASQTTPCTRHPIGWCPHFDLLNARCLHRLLSALAVQCMAANRTMSSPVHSCLAPSPRVQGLVPCASAPSLAPFLRSTCLAAAAFPCACSTLAVVPAVAGDQACAYKDARPPLGFSGPPATSPARSDSHRVYLTRLRCPLVVSHDLEAFFRTLACGLVSCRCHPWASPTPPAPPRFGFLHPLAKSAAPPPRSRQRQLRLRRACTHGAFPLRGFLPPSLEAPARAHGPSPLLSWASHDLRVTAAAVGSCKTCAMLTYRVGRVLFRVSQNSGIGLPLSRAAFPLEVFGRSAPDPLPFRILLLAEARCLLLPVAFLPPFSGSPARASEPLGPPRDGALSAGQRGAI